MSLANEDYVYMTLTNTKIPTGSRLNNHELKTTKILLIYPKN